MFSLIQQLDEMAKAKICPKCGHQMTGYHYYYKGEWKCKSSSLANPGSATAGIAAQQPPTGTQPTGTQPTGTQPTGTQPTGTQPTGTQPTGTQPPVPTTAQFPVAHSSVPPRAPSVAPTQSAPTAHVTPTIDMVKGWLDKHHVTNYTIDPEDLSVDVNGDVSLINIRHNRIPVNFNEVSGDFHLSSPTIKNLMGCPYRCKSFYLEHVPQLVSLRGIPNRVHNMRITCIDVPTTLFTDALGLRRPVNADGVTLNLTGKVISFKGIDELFGEVTDISVSVNPTDYLSHLVALKQLYHHAGLDDGHAVVSQSVIMRTLPSKIREKLDDPRVDVHAFQQMLYDMGERELAKI